MTTENRPEAHEYNPTTLLSDLQELGRERTGDGAAGGVVFAAFADFCWHTGAPLTSGHLELWLDTLTDDVHSTVGVAHARAMVEARS